MKRKITGILLLAASVLYSAVSGVFAYSGGGAAEVHNYVRTGDIDISLKQYDAEGEVFRDGYVWTPGDHIDNVVQVENEAKDCWIRLKAQYDDVITVSGISKQWIYRAPYWYYTEILNEKEKVIFSKQFYFSEKATGETEGKEDFVEMTAEAIQAIHFTPDFEAEEPWGDQTAELCVHVKDGNEEEREKPYENLTLCMEKEAGCLVAAPNDFFVNLSELMPGDIQSDSVTVNNIFNRSTELFFRVEDSADMTEAQRDLLEQLGLTIYKNEETIYKGDLRSLELRNEISLGIWKSGEQGIIRYEISMPEELKNEYAVRDAKINWIFRTVLEEDTPKTGDREWTAAYLAVALLSGVIGIWLVFRREER